MLSRETFSKSMFVIATANNIELNNDVLSAMYRIMKDDFNDEEFEKISIIVAKKENLYNSMPKPNMFYKYKFNNSTEDLQCSKFLEKVGDIISDRSYMQHTFNENEKRALNCCGGISNIYTMCKNNPNSWSFIQKELKENFINFYKHESNNNAISDSRVKKLLKGIFK